MLYLFVLTSIKTFSKGLKFTTLHLQTHKETFIHAKNYQYYDKHLYDCNKSLIRIEQTLKISTCTCVEMIISSSKKKFIKKSVVKFRT